VILLVTSHAQTRDNLGPLIAQRGYPVSHVDCGESVMAHVRFKPTSAVILDCGLPDAFELLEMIRGDHRTRATPVVMFSADDRDLRDRALLKGADSYVPKGSMDWAELLAEIERLAGGPPMT
jgi:DNA-binding response OmpR family regulator